MSAPRPELLKLGFMVCERTVSRMALAQRGLNVETLLAEARGGGEDESGYPKFVEKAIRHYLAF